MEPNWAAEQLQVIRTLMERAAVYRRALAPIMSYVGAVGLLAALVATVLQINTARGFVGFWLGVGAVAAAGAFLLVRRQALKEAEPFWSLPTRRVARAVLPAFFTGFFLSILLLAAPKSDWASPLALPALWLVLYACGLHSAGSFMARGIRLFGWLLLLGGSGLLAAALFTQQPPAFLAGHWIMGAAFGGLHLAYGTYLYFTEKGGKSA